MNKLYLGVDAAFQAEDMVEDLEKSGNTVPPLPSQLAVPEADLYGDNALEIEF